MVHLASVPSPFEARILAARLGAEGIVWELRGADSVYPVGPVQVLVEEDGADRARELLLADEVEAVFDDDGPDEGLRLGHRDWWVIAVGALLIGLFVFARMLAFG